MPRTGIDHGAGARSLFKQLPRSSSDEIRKPKARYLPTHIRPERCRRNPTKTGSKPPMRKLDSEAHRPVRDRQSRGPEPQRAKRAEPRANEIDDMMFEPIHLDVPENATERAAVESLYAAGCWLHSHARFADAANIFRLMLQAAPTDERSWLALGDCHERLGQRSIALELYSTGAIAAEPAPRCMAARARALREAGDTEQAEEAFEAARSLAAVARIDNRARVVRQHGRCLS